MATPLWIRFVGPSFCAALMACAARTYERTTTLPVSVSAAAAANLTAMGYTAVGYATPWDSQATRVSWVVLREGREDRLLVRMTTRLAQGSTPQTGAAYVAMGHRISISARSYITDGSGQRRPTRPSAAVRADADSLMARVRASGPIETTPLRP
jgi:hypothetical protein